MDHFDKVWTGIALFGILLIVIGEIVYLRRGEVVAGRFGRIWPIAGTAVIIPVLHIFQHHGQFLPIALIFFGWFAVFMGYWWREDRKKQDQEIAEGRIPKIYNDWVKPDPP